MYFIYRKSTFPIDNPEIVNRQSLICIAAKLKVNTNLRDRTAYYSRRLVYLADMRLVFLLICTATLGLGCFHLKSQNIDYRAFRSGRGAKKILPSITFTRPPRAVRERHILWFCFYMDVVVKTITPPSETRLIRRYVCGITSVITVRQSRSLFYHPRRRRDGVSIFRT